jgi:hypothetical protein
MIFVISSNGFVVKCIYNPRKNKTEIEYTKSLQNARIFKSTIKANEYIKKHNLFAFVWSPKNEEPIRDKYKIIYGNKKYIDFFNNNNEPNVWFIEKVKMESKSDLKFLNSSLPNDLEYYDFDAATKICNERNIELIKQIVNLSKLIK